LSKNKFVLYGLGESLAYFFGRKWKVVKKVTCRARERNDVGQLLFLKKKRMWLMRKKVVFLAEGKKKGRALMLCGESGEVSVVLWIGAWFVVMLLWQKKAMLMGLMMGKKLMLGESVAVLSCEKKGVMWCGVLLFSSEELGSMLL